jgi:hypothetical protein
VVRAHERPARDHRALTLTHSPRTISPGSGPQAQPSAATTPHQDPELSTRSNTVPRPTRGRFLRIRTFSMSSRAPRYAGRQAGAAAPGMRPVPAGPGAPVRPWPCRHPMKRAACPHQKRGPYPASSVQAPPRHVKIKPLHVDRSNLDAVDTPLWHLRGDRSGAE